VNTKEKKKGISLLKGCAIALLVIVVLLGIGGGIGWSFLTKEHREAASLPLEDIDFDRLSDGQYHGVYAGGMYGWRFNECDVTVQGGKVTDIQLKTGSEVESVNADAEMLYARVIEAQSLQVDAISGATLTSKSYLKAVENALLQAQP